MFVSHKLSPSKKTFQKPNILRRKTKATTIRSGPCNPSPAPTAAETNLSVVDWEAQDQRPVKRVQLEVLAQDVACSVSTHDTLAGVLVRDVANTLERETNTVEEETALDDEIEPSTGTNQELVDVEAFLNGPRTTQFNTQYEVQSKLESNSAQKWQIDFENSTDNIIMEPLDEGLQVLPADEDPDGPALAAEYDHFTMRPGTFMCLEPSCNKAFLTEQKLRRHRAVHNKRSPRPASVECPAGARGAPGEGQGAPGAGQGAPGAGRCGRVFAAREQLARHLRDDHVPEDALHGCGLCGRRFFWAVGLRAHGRAHAARGGAREVLQCPWPGCGRAFRQPCRLREHARAHTGDRPYRCKHPGCPWAFRTASKLLRHARRHTGERRHACACGRAFRRREHLREHQARHRPTLSLPDTEDGSPVSRRRTSRVPEMPVVGAEPGAGAPGTTPPAPPAPPEPSSPEGAALDERQGDEDEFMVRLEAGPGPRRAEAEPRAARTHCTWPLAPPQPAVAEEPACSVRSDLFLPAHDDDSQQMIGGTASAEPPLEAAASPLPGLGLLDLMQEELLYTDAVDESFQVLLLSEELG